MHASNVNAVQQSRKLLQWCIHDPPFDCKVCYHLVTKWFYYKPFFRYKQQPLSSLLQFIFIIVNRLQADLGCPGNAGPMFRCALN